MVEVSIFYLFIIIALSAVLSSGQESRDCTNNTINDFWHESVDNCPVDLRNAAEIFHKLSDKKESNDQFSELLRYHIEDTLKNAMVQEIITIISSESLGSENKLTTFSEEFTDNYGNLARLVWTKALEELIRTMESHKLMQQILLIRNDRLKYDILQHIWHKFSYQMKTDAKLAQIMTFGVTTLLRNSERLTTSQIIQADAALEQLPQVFVTIYQAWNYNVSLFNHHYNEYMFADSDKGPSPQQRFLFTYIPPKTSFNIQGKFLLHFNPQGLVALSTIFEGSPRFLKRRNNDVYFCLDCDPTEDMHWWNVVLASEGSNDHQNEYVYFQCPESQDLLCATTEYDKYRRWVQKLTIKDRGMVKSCQWKVIKKRK